MNGLLITLVLILGAAVAGCAVLLRRLLGERAALLNEKDVIYGFVHDVGDVFVDADTVDLNLLLKRVLFYALRTTRAAAGAVFLFEPNRENLRAHATSGIFPPLTGNVDKGLERSVSRSQHIEEVVLNRLIPRGQGVVGEVGDQGKPLLIPYAETDPRIPRYDVDFLQIRSLLLVPMRFHRTVLGVLAVINPVDGAPFVPADMSVLQALADQASVSVHYVGLREMLNEKQVMDHDLGIAQRIQSALLPKEIPEVEGVELAAFNYPARTVGGDYYDFIQVDDTHIGIAIADVSGKGTGGAIMMSECRSMLRARAQTDASPAGVLRGMNRVIAEDLTEDMFISILYMVFNTETREIAIARAGHERAILFRADPRKLELVDSHGMAVGIADPELFDKVLEDKVIQLQPGDLVVAYTDGITEAMNCQGKEWGLDSVLATINVAGAEGAQAVLKNIRERLDRFVGDQPQYDDMTLIALWVMR